MPPHENQSGLIDLAATTADCSPIANRQLEQLTNQRKYPTIAELKAVIPRRCFVKSIPRSIAYMLLDFAILAAMYSMAGVFASFGWAGKLVWWFYTGMFMSSLFVVGHDCGHGSFSDYGWLNDICGHVCHVPLLAPFWPWAKSHRLHHTYHAHITKDYGHPWVTKGDFEDRNILFKWLLKNPLSALIRWFPGYTLVGIPDGSHFWPFSRLFVNNVERLQCAVSTGLCAMFAYFVYRLLDGNWWLIADLYIVPLLFHGFWLIMITFLHHQDEDINIYDGDKWNYVKGAFETVDRPYGFGFDQMLHHITDGHVAHHLFFTQMPHYHLDEATKAISAYLLTNYPKLYKRRRSWDFLWKFTRLNYVLDFLDGSGGVFSFDNCLHKNDSSYKQ